MDPSSTQPYRGAAGSAGSDPTYSATDSQFSTTSEPSHGGSNYSTDRAAQPAASGVQGTLDNALESGKKWLNDSGILDQATKLPQTAKDLGSKAWERVSGLTTTQKAVGVGLLAAGVALLATLGRRKSSDEGEYRHKPRRSPFSHKPFGEADDDSKGGSGRPWGSSRFGGARANSGSGYSSGPSADFGREGGNGRGAGWGSNSPGSSARRDQGPASGSRYDARTSGSQNPNNAG